MKNVKFVKIYAGEEEVILDFETGKVSFSLFIADCVSNGCDGWFVNSKPSANIVAIAVETGGRLDFRTKA